MKKKRMDYAPPQCELEVILNECSLLQSSPYTIDDYTETNGPVWDE